MFTNENGFVYDLTKTCAFENTAELGLIGGTASDVDKTNGHVFRVYAQRTDTALVVYIAKDDLSELPAGYTIELYSHVYNFVKSRTENTLDTMITTDGTISRVAAFPSNKMTNITNLGVTAQKINDKYVKATIPYAHLYQFVPSWYTADIRTPLGLSMVARNSTYSGCSVWYRPDMPGFSNSQEVVRGNTKDYIMIAADGTLSLTFKEDRITKDIFNELAGVNVFDNLAETTSSSTKSTVTLGGYPFSDRTTHTFDGGMIKALDGMHYYYDGVKENTAVTATTAGYIIVVDSVKNSGIPENCQAVITNAANIGLLTAGATLTDYYIVYLEAGESFTAFGTGDVLIIGA